MNRILSITFLVFLLTSCGNKREGEEKTGLLSNLVSITDNENNGIEEILGFYGGRCEYSIGVSASTSDGTKKYFEIEMSQSDAIDKRLDKVYLPSSNIAYRFYKNLKEEKKNYDEIKVVLISKDNKKQEFNFPITLLEKAEKRIKVAEKTVSLLKEKQFEELKEMLNNELVAFDKEELIPRLKEFEPQLGNILEFRLFGFKITEIKDKELMHISGAIIRDKQNNEFSVDIDFNSDKYELYQLQYKL
ncbi:hypothetical protein [Mesoflavibacter sp. CH_XMU1422-2]|uniref:hypothetical protein n=1 Tax=Mesoflavibacter sp. CH_XMU1422-2 TaxID=3107770 RepID=UPI00300803DD|tara:strand:- start:56 stop:793 length:738 start_codon:yes stop_codon:yes gene_type:complete